MTPQEMRDRTDRFSVSIIQFCRSKIPCDVLLLRLLTQLKDAATSVASNYHAAGRAQSRAQFVAKLSIAVEEADECVGWLHKLTLRDWRRHPSSRRSGRKPGKSRRCCQHRGRQHRAGVPSTAITDDPMPR